MATQAGERDCRCAVLECVLSLVQEVSLLATDACASANDWLLKETARGEWGFEGYVTG
jgi:beta-glucosidase-like glycosyl hydrolase